MSKRIGALLTIDGDFAGIFLGEDDAEAFAHMLHEEGVLDDGRVCETTRVRFDYDPEE